MILIFLVLLIGVATFNIKFGFNKNYLTKKSTTSVNGLFILLVFLSHSKGYLNLEGVSGKIYGLFFATLGQMIVVMFFFILALD